MQLINIKNILIFVVYNFSICASIQEDINERINLGYNNHITASFFTPENQKIFYAGEFICPPEKAIFEIGSLSKIFTAHLVFLLEDEGAISTHRLIKEYLPESWKIRETPITLDHLLSHTSGIFDPMSSHYRNPDTGNTVLAAEFSSEDLKRYLDQLTISNAPGENLEYSNLGYALVGYILETITGTCYAKLLQEKILIPYQMQSTFVDIPLAAKKNLVEGSENGEKAPFWHPKMPAYASIKSTIHDMTCYAQALFFKEDEQIKRIREKLTLPVKKIQNLPIETTRGLTIDRRFGGEIFAGGGRTLGFSCFLGFQKKQNIGYVLLTDASSLDELGHRWLNSNFPKPQLYKSINLKPSQLKKYEGIYSSKDRSFELEVKARNGSLVLLASKEFPVILYPLSESEFFSKDLSLSKELIQFKEMPDGKNLLIIKFPHGSMVLQNE